MRIMAYPVDEGGCGWYRVRQPLHEIFKHTDSDMHIMDEKKDKGKYEAIAKALTQAEVWLLRQGAHQAVEKFVNKYNFLKENKALWVVDLDDNVNNISPFSTHYDEWGVREVAYGDKMLWEDGVNIDIKLNKSRVNNVLESYKKADLLTVTTQKLKEHAQQYNNHVEIIPNTINFEWWWKPNRKPNKRIRIGWSGGSSHYEDLYTIKEPLNKLMREHDLEFWNTGSYFKGIFDEDNRKRVTVRPWVDFNGHSYHLMSQHLDIAIAPLKDMEFNYYKSPIKYLEYSAMKVPTIATNIPPYSDTITNNHNGILHNTPEEFYKAVLTLIERPDLRKQLANNAYKLVKSDYDSRKWARKHVRIYEQHVKRLRKSQSRNSK